MLTRIVVFCFVTVFAISPCHGRCGYNRGDQYKEIERRYIDTEKVPEPIAAYSKAVVIGDTMYITGAIGTKVDVGLVSDDIGEQAEQSMKNIGYILEAAGIDFGNVVKCSLYLKDIGDLYTVNNVYKRYFPNGNYPARVSIEVGANPAGAIVMIECVAAMGTIVDIDQPCTL